MRLPVLALFSFALAALAFPMFGDVTPRHYPSSSLAASHGIKPCLHAGQTARKFVLPDPIANFSSKVIPGERQLFLMVLLRVAEHLSQTTIIPSALHVSSTVADHAVRLPPLPRYCSHHSLQLPCKPEAAHAPERTLITA